MAVMRAVGYRVYLVIIKGGSIAAEDESGSDAQYIGNACSVRNVLWTTLMRRGEETLYARGGRGGRGDKGGERSL